LTLAPVGKGVQTISRGARPKGQLHLIRAIGVHDERMLIAAALCPHRPVEQDLLAVGGEGGSPLNQIIGDELHRQTGAIGVDHADFETGTTSPAGKDNPRPMW
jgi:hypothetical protein